MPRNPFDELNVELPAPTQQPPDYISKRKPLARHLRRDFSQEYFLLDKALRSNLSIRFSTEHEAVALRQRLYNARSAQREIFRDTEHETKYDSLFVSMHSEHDAVVLQVRVLDYSITEENP